MKIPGALLLMLSLLAPSRVFASEGARGSVGLYGGFSTAGADGLNNGALFGGSASFFFTERLGVEAGVRRQSLDVVATPSNALSGGSLDSTVITGSLVFRFPGRRVAPYVVAGVAHYSNRFEVASAVSSQLEALNFRVTEEVEGGVGFNVGAGADWRVANRLALFGEVRYLAGSTDTRAELADTISGTAAEAAGSQDLNGLEIRGGVRFVFASAPRKAP
jgi:opacity protein-like surface antigen